MKTIHAVYEKGVFRPLEKVELPDHCEVEFAPRIVNTKSPKPGSMDAIYEIMSQRFETGEHDIAARHNEHQP
jgi:predicted DNA-binding antitoxin AbrB/MazE fold protein